MSWSQAKEAIRDAIALAVRAPDYLGGDGVTYIHVTEWRNKRDAARWAPSGPVVDLTLSSVVGKGTDETRYETFGSGDPEDIKEVPVYNGYRLLSVQVEVDSDSQEDDADAPGFYTGALRTRLRRDDVLAILQAGGVALVSVGPTFEADFLNQSGRMQSRAITEVRFATTEEDTDGADGSGDWVATAAGEGVDGSDLDGASFDTAL